MQMLAKVSIKKISDSEHKINVQCKISVLYTTSTIISNLKGNKNA